MLKNAVWEGISLGFICDTTRIFIIQLVNTDSS